MPGRHFGFLIGPKNSNLIEDVKFLLPVSFRWIPRSGFREEVENASANKRPGRPSWFLIDQKNTPNLSSFIEFRSAVTKIVKNVYLIRGQDNIDKGRWDLASCQVLLNSVQRFQMSTRKFSANKRPGRNLGFQISPENTNYEEDFGMYNNRPKWPKPDRGRWDHVSCQDSMNPPKRFQIRSRKCLSQSEVSTAILDFRSDRKKPNLVEDIEIFLLVNVIEFNVTVLEKKLKMSQLLNQRPRRPSWFYNWPENPKRGRRRWDLASCKVLLNFPQLFQRRSRKGLRGQDGHLRFQISQKNTNLIEDIQILLPVSFRWIPRSGFREEVENASANKRPGRPSWFSDRPEKHPKLGRGHWDLASCQVLLNCVRRLQKLSKMFQLIIGQDGHLGFQIDPKKKTTLIEDVEILLPVKFCWIPRSGFREEAENISANQRPGQQSGFSDTPKKKPTPNLVEDVEILLLVKFCSIPSCGFREDVENTQPIRGQEGNLDFPIGQKKTNLVEDVEIFLPVKFRWILFNGWEKKSKMSQLLNKRLGRPSRPKKHKLDRGRWYLASCQVLLNSLQWFMRKSRKCLSQSEVGTAILNFRSTRKKDKLGRIRWDVVSC